MGKGAAPAGPEVELPPPPPVGDRKNFHWVKIPANKFEGSIFERLHKLKDDG